jgi:alpha-ketoglutarate-dependent taurine dioxygenase
MPDDRAVDLIAELDARCVRPEFLYRHQWRVRDLLMGDNACSSQSAITACPNGA